MKEIKISGDGVEYEEFSVEELDATTEDSRTTDYDPELEAFKKKYNI